MGYSHRLYILEKELVQQIAQMNYDQFKQWGLDRGIADQPYSENEAVYVPLYDIGPEFYDFGKYFEAEKEMQETGRPLFLHLDLKNEYEEYAPYIVGKEALLCAIELYKKNVISSYEKMLSWNEKDQEDDWKERTKQQFIEDSISSILREWKNNSAYNTSDKTPAITSSWKYEYAVFELVRLYKSTDWDKYELLFMGW